MMIAIDKNIPMISKELGIVADLPFDKMEIGDSFFVQDATSKQISSRIHHHHVRISRTKKFTCRTVDGGVRVWRVS